MLGGGGGGGVVEKGGGTGDQIRRSGAVEGKGMGGVPTVECISLLSFGRSSYLFLWGCGEGMDVLACMRRARGNRDDLGQPTSSAG